MASEEDIIRRESGGRAYIGFGGVDLSNAPLDRYGFPIWEGRMGPAGISHAAGLHQFQPKTWREGAAALGISDFSAASQKRVYEWTRAKYGEAPWAASAPGGGGGGLRGGGGRDRPFTESGEGYVEVSRPVTDGAPEALLQALLASGGGEPTLGTETEAGPSALLTSLLAEPQGSPQASETPAGTQTQPPEPSADVARPQRVPGLFDRIGGVVTQFNPIGSARAEGMPQPERREEPSAAEVAQKASAPAMLLDALLGGLSGVMDFQSGAREGFAAAASGEAIGDRAPQMSRPQAAGAAIGAVPGVLASPVVSGARQLDQAMRGEGMDPGEMAAAAGVGMTGSIGRGGMGAGPRLPPRQEPPPLRVGPPPAGATQPPLGPAPQVQPPSLPPPPSAAAPPPSAAAPTPPAAIPPPLGRGGSPGAPPPPTPPAVAPGGPPGGGGAPPPPPGAAAPPPPTPPPSGRVARAVAAVKAKVAEYTRDAQIKAAPMAAGTEAGQAIAKDFANSERLARFRRTRWDKALGQFPEADRKAMWEAMDNASVAAQAHGVAAGRRYIDALPKAQRDLLMEMEDHGVELWESARAEGMVHETAERLPFYVPRAIVEIAADGGITVPPSKGGGGMRNLDQPGVNLNDRGPMKRSYTTVDETEAAAQARFGAGAQVVRDIRVLPLKYEQFERNIAGRRLINELENIGAAVGKPVVQSGPGPGHFTLPHPAFQTWRPKFTTDAAGNTVPLRDPATSRIVFEKTPLYVAREFEGPLRAVLRGEDNVLYRTAMDLKAGSMSLIMNSPLIHNMVEWGRALPAMPGKVATFRIYSIGNKVMQDRPMMEQAIKDGMVPIGERGYLQDIEGIASADDLKPGRSITSQVLGFPADMIGKGDAVRSAIDKAGDFWHYRLLWKQVAKLQAGLYKEIREHLIHKGIDPDAAGKMSAHFANRYAGALPHEAMGQMARKLLNFALFSRSFTMGNLGVMKDMVTGLPRDVRAQIGRDLSAVEKQAASSLARRKAIGIFMLDVALYHVGNTLLQNGLQLLRGDEGLPEVLRDYADRAGKLLNRAKESPLEAISPFHDLESLSATSENEPGKENRVLLGHQKDGTGIYGRLPTGKIGEEFSGWLTQPLYQLRNKEGTIARPLFNTLANDKGFGQKVYDPNYTGLKGTAENIGRIGWEFLRTQIPEMQIKAAMDIIGGKDKGALPWAQLVSPFFGFTVSRGAPGGEAVGQMYQTKRLQKDKVDAALPEIKEMIEAGKRDEAVEKMRALNMPPGLIRYYTRIYTNPGSRVSPRQLRDFERSAKPEDRERMQKFRREPRPSVIGP